MMNKLFLAVGFILAVSVTCGNPNGQYEPTKTDYVCLDMVVKGESADGRGTIFTLIQVRHSECESVVMPSPLSQADQRLLYTMRRSSSDTYELYIADELNTSGGEKRKWTPLIEQGVKSFEIMRSHFCSEHPDAFVYDLTADGRRTAPQACIVPIPANAGT